MSTKAQWYLISWIESGTHHSLAVREGEMEREYLHQVRIIGITKLPKDYQPW